MATRAPDTAVRIVPDPLKQQKDEKDLSGLAMYVCGRCRGRNERTNERRAARSLSLSRICIVQVRLPRLPFPPTHYSLLTTSLPPFATSWSVSSAKPGNGVDLLVDGRNDSFWQSDGSQPHCITLQFQEPVELSKVAIACDFRVDESYTPQRITIRVGTRWSDLVTVRTEEVVEPQGWIVIPLGGGVGGRVLQILVLANHQNGRDTHVRQVRVFGPRKELGILGGRARGRVGWRGVESAMYASVR